MFEILIAAGLLAGAIVAFGGRDDTVGDTAVIVPINHLPSDDLPCPWCGAETQEEDAYCPSCRQPFG